MRFRVIQEVIFELTVEASSGEEAQRLASQVPYSQWDKGYPVREECVPVEEDPLNPHGF
ncbi:MAG: hypothetical protein HYU29_04450 [Chloroflexi bacterium]|nr:hypothetical protein [Chloroflexota bacterium]